MGDELRLIVSGPRSITDHGRIMVGLDRAWMRLGLGGRVVGVMHGDAPGVDRGAKRWIQAQGWTGIAVPYAEGGRVCAACLSPLDDPPPKCLTTGEQCAPDPERARWGKIRNRLMLHRALLGWHRERVAWLALWDRMSSGTSHGIALAATAGVKFSVEVIP